MEISCVKTLVVPPRHHRPEDGNSDAQQLQKPNHVIAKQPQVQGSAEEKNYQNTQGKVLWPVGMGAPLQGMFPSSGRDKRAFVEIQTLFRLPVSRG